MKPIRIDCQTKYFVYLQLNLNVPMNHFEFGTYGEHMAVRHLQAEGHQILTTNYRYAGAEIDIVSHYQKKLVISEVKIRSGASRGDPRLTITLRKQRQILKATNQFIQQHRIDTEVQFDILLIEKSREQTTIRHIENAFYPLV